MARNLVSLVTVCPNPGGGARLHASLVASGEGDKFVRTGLVNLVEYRQCWGGVRQPCNLAPLVQLAHQLCTRQTSRSPRLPRLPPPSPFPDPIRTAHPSHHPSAGAHPQADDRLMLMMPDPGHHETMGSQACGWESINLPPKATTQPHTHAEADAHDACPPRPKNTNKCPYYP